jgi:ABC-type Fe3+ transport system substrate-binding protein
MLGRVSWVLVVLAVIVAAPLVLRRDSEVGAAGSADDRLVVITPHNETIRSEFGEAFAGWWRERSGRTVYVDWRTPGGTTELRRVLDSGFDAADEGGREGVGVDVFFGGGDYEFRKQAEKGRLVPLEVFESHPQWFEPGVIPASFTGERYYAADRSWVGVCLSQFGICYNVDTLERLGVPRPERWADLADPRLRGQVALADPTKSGSVTRAFEMILQQQMQRELERGGVPPDEALAEGWQRGIRLLQAIGANARYFSDSATKIPHDVAQGDSAVGMSIDFYGRSYNEKLKRPDGRSRLEWVAPVGGTSLSVDPVGVLRGAPHPELAHRFVEFLLSERGQLLWNARPGTPPGPVSRALRRMPVRRDLYTPDRLAWFSDPEALPYQRTGGFEYRSELTGRAFGALGLIVRAMCIDSHDELKAAWAALAESGGPPEARVLFEDVSAVSYRRVMDELVPMMKSADPVEVVRYSSGLGERFREQYRRARALAEGREGRP